LGCSRCARSRPVRNLAGRHTASLLLPARSSRPAHALLCCCAVLC
jgi:hypothetical protein